MYMYNDRVSHAHFATLNTLWIGRQFRKLSLFYQMFGVLCCFMLYICLRIFHSQKARMSRTWTSNNGILERLPVHCRPTLEALEIITVFVDKNISWPVTLFHLPGKCGHGITETLPVLLEAIIIPSNGDPICLILILQELTLHFRASSSQWRHSSPNSDKFKDTCRYMHEYVNTSQHACFQVGTMNCLLSQHENQSQQRKLWHLQRRRQLSAGDCLMMMMKMTCSLVHQPKLPPVQVSPACNLTWPSFSAHRPG